MPPQGGPAVRRTLSVFQEDSGSVAQGQDASARRLPSAGLGGSFGEGRLASFHKKTAHLGQPRESLRQPLGELGRNQAPAAKPVAVKAQHARQKQAGSQLGSLAGRTSSIFTSRPPSRTLDAYPRPSWPIDFSNLAPEYISPVPAAMPDYGGYEDLGPVPIRCWEPPFSPAFLAAYAQAEAYLKAPLDEPEDLPMDVPLDR